VLRLLHLGVRRKRFIEYSDQLSRVELKNANLAICGNGGKALAIRRASQTGDLGLLLGKLKEACKINEFS